MAQAESMATGLQNEKVDDLVPAILKQDDYAVNLQEDLEMVNPDVHELFAKYNKAFFDNKIGFCEVQWIDADQNAQEKEQKKDNPKAKKKKKYAGKCAKDAAGLCVIYLEKTILQFKSTKYIIETLIHHMIHSYLLQHEKESDLAHSDLFKSIMDAINNASQPHMNLTLNNKQCRKNDDFPSEIIPDQLYLGNIHHALNLEVLQTIGITHIVNCSQTIENRFENDGIKYCRVPVNDKVTVSILPFFVKAIRFVEAVREENGGKNEHRILIHCHAGISRSATITIAYLMFSWKLTMFDAITHVQSKRFIIQPNQGFKNQLLDFYLYLEENEGNLDDFEKKHKQQAEMNGIANVNGLKRVKSVQKVACPVCDKFFGSEQINAHLDECMK